MTYIDTSKFEPHISNSHLYQNIARENLWIARQYFDKKQTAKTAAEFGEFVAHCRKYSIITIVFVQMALEAFINTYSLGNISRSQHKKKYRYLNLRAKWAEIPKCVTGASITSENLDRLENLEKLRHSLVHSEPVKLPDEEEAFRELSKQIVDDVIKGAEEAIETIDLLFANLVLIDPAVGNHVLLASQETDT